MKKIILCLAVLSLAGCATGNGVTYESNRHTTIGQELIDLRKAYDEKIITSDEYEKLKLDITSSAALTQEKQ